MFPFLKGGALQLVFMVAVMASVVTLQAQITTKLTQGNSGNIVYTKVDNLQKISAADDGPGGLCNMSDPCNASAGGCRDWEKCVNGVCNDTTNGGSRPASSDSCGGSGGGGGQNPTNTPFPTRAPNCGCSQPNEHCTMCDTGRNVCIGRCEDADGGGVATPTPTTGSGTNSCRTLTIEGTLWEANCSKSCSSNANCPKRTSGDTNPDTSNWCYQFSNGSYCLMRNQSGGGGGGGVTPGAGTPVATPTSNASVVTGCFTLGADVSRSQENGKYKFDVSVKFISLGGDGDVKLDRDGRHVAGWNAWNKSVKSVFTYSSQWTGGSIKSSGNVNFVGTVANSAACPNVQSSMSCTFNVDDGSCNCGGSSCASVNPTQPQNSPTFAPGITSTITSVPTRTPTAASCNPGESRCFVGGPCAEQGQCPASPTPTKKVCSSPYTHLCPDGRTCVASAIECAGIAANTPTPTKVVASTPFKIVPTSAPASGAIAAGTTRVQISFDPMHDDLINLLSGVSDPGLMVFDFSTRAGQTPVNYTPVAATRTNNTFIYTFQGLPANLGAPASIGFTSPLSSGGNTQKIFLNGMNSGL